jgi:hypothetical protein
MPMRPTLTRNVTAPIVVELGKASRAEVAELRRGAGRLVEDVEQVMRLVRSTGISQDENRVFVPVVTLYSKD